MTMLSISILLLPNTEKDISKAFKNNFQTTQGWEEREKLHLACSRTVIMTISNTDKKKCIFAYVISFTP